MDGYWTEIRHQEPGKIHDEKGVAKGVNYISFQQSNNLFQPVDNHDPTEKNTTTDWECVRTGPLSARVWTRKPWSSALIWLRNRQVRPHPEKIMPSASKDNVLLDWGFFTGMNTPHSNLLLQHCNWSQGLSPLWARSMVQGYRYCKILASETVPGSADFLLLYFMLIRV